MHTHPLTTPIHTHTHTLTHITGRSEMCRRLCLALWRSTLLVLDVVDG